MTDGVISPADVLAVLIVFLLLVDCLWRALSQPDERDRSGR